MLLQFPFLPYFEIVSYNLQHKIAVLLLEITSSFQINTFFLFFFVGVITIFNPCFISIIPLSISYLNSYQQNIYKKVLILGLVSSILIIILITSFVSYNSFLYLTRIPLLSLTILVILSLNLLQILNFSFYPSTFIVNMKWISFQNDDLIQCYFVGFIIGFTTIPCSSPIFTIMHLGIYNLRNVFILSLYIISYFLGCVLPLLLVFYLFINYLQTRVLVYFSNIINPLVGFLTLTLSLFFLLEKFLL